MLEMTPMMKKFVLVTPTILFLKTPHHPQIARKGIKWVKEGSKWSCAVGEYYNEIAKW
jgi:hypothetical protein